MYRFLLLPLLLAAGLNAAELRIPNRAPQPGEVGYLPEDGSVPDLNPPSLVWLHESAAQTYTVQWSRAADFHGAQTASGLAFNCYTHDQPLAPGEYFWRYQYTTVDRKASGWSTTRRFTVSEKAAEFPLPGKAARKQLVPASHPRLFVRPEDLPQLRRAAETNRVFAGLRTRAEKQLNAPLTPEPREPGTASNKTNLTLLKNWWANRVQVLQACEEAETAAFVYLVTGESRFGNDARRRILDIAQWDPDAETNFRRNCEAAKPLLHRLARAYDWAYAALTPEDRARVQAAVKRRVQDAWVSGEVGRGVGHLNRPYNSHGNRTWHKIGESGIVFLGEIPEAEVWLDYAVNKFHACYPVWSDADGGWHEGLSYWGGYMSKVVWWLQASKSALQIDGFQKPFFDHAGDFALYLAPPGATTMGFGDLSGRAPSQSWGGFLEYFLRESSQRPGSNARYWAWWSDQWKMDRQGGILGFLYQATLPALPAPKAPTDLPVSKVFQGIGVASLHNTLLNTRDDVHFLLKSSPFGTASHGHNAQNGFQLSAYGDTLLPACVYRDYHGTKFHYNWVHETVSQNSLLVNGKGQVPHSSASRGRIVASRFERDWDYVAGDAAAAYPGRLDRFLRHVVFVKPDFIVLCDEVAAPEPATFELMLHALSPFELDNTKQRLRVQQKNSGLLVQYLAPEPLKLRQWDGFEPKPIRGDFANHWHVEAGTATKTTSAALLTVLAPHRKGQEPALDARRLESATATGVRAQIGERRIFVAIRKAGVSGPAELDGRRFDDAVLVEAN